MNSYYHNSVLANPHERNNAGLDTFWDGYYGETTEAWEIVNIYAMAHNTSVDRMGLIL